MISMPITRGGVVTLDAPFLSNDNTTNIGELCKIIHVATGGDLIIENQDGVPQVFIGLLSGSTIPCIARRVLSAATINGNPYTNGCGGITWHGGD
jgi:hypothetical protein